MSQHTPGPWVVKYSHREGFRWAVETTHPRFPTFGEIALIPYSSALETDEQNTHLICAAPELLAALKETVDAECSLHCPSVWRTGKPQPHTDTCKRARAAIAKAEGRT